MVARGTAFANEGSRGGGVTRLRRCRYFRENCPNINFFANTSVNCCCFLLLNMVLPAAPFRRSRSAFPCMAASVWARLGRLRTLACLPAPRWWSTLWRRIESMPTGRAYRMGVQVFMVLALEGYSNKKYLQVGRTAPANPQCFAH